MMCSEEMGEVGGGVIHVETLKDFSILCLFP